MGERRSKSISAEAMMELQDLIKAASSGTDVRRLQCVYFRGKGLSLENIAELVQYSPGHVQRIWTQFFKEGAESLLTKPRGGRRHEYLDTAEEEALLKAHTTKGEAGGILKIEPLHQALCAKVGREVALSTTYRMAHRHGWRKLEPRPHHPGRNQTAAEYFKVFFPEAPGGAQG